MVAILGGARAWLRYADGTWDRFSAAEYRAWGRRDAPALPPGACGYLGERWLGMPRAYFDQRGALSFDAAAATNDVFVTSITYALTVAAGSDLALFLGAIQFRNSGGTTITGATYNAVAATQQVQAGVSAGRRLALFSLVAPATGAHNVVVTYSDGNGQPFSATAAYQGVDQTTPMSNAATFDSSGTTINPSVASAVGNLAVAHVGSATASNGLAATGSTTQRVTNGSQRQALWDVAGAATATVTGSISISDAWFGTIASLNAASAGPPVEAGRVGGGRRFVSWFTAS